MYRIIECRSAKKTTVLANIIENRFNTIGNIKNTSENIKIRNCKQHNLIPNLILAVIRCKNMYSYLLLDTIVHMKTNQSSVVKPNDGPVRLLISNRTKIKTKVIAWLPTKVLPKKTFRSTCINFCKLLFNLKEWILSMIIQVQATEEQTKAEKNAIMSHLARNKPAKTRHIFEDTILLDTWSDVVLCMMGYSPKVTLR